MKHYILNDDHSISEAGLYEWAKWFESAKRIVKQETIAGKMISTVFLGIDHGQAPMGMNEPPILFETMVFDQSKPGHERFMDERCERYATWDEAVAGHDKIAKEVWGHLHDDQ